MASPIYIICSEGGALDQLTNSVSIFGIIETLRFADLNQVKGNSESPGRGSPWINIRMTAAWKRDESDAGTTFEHQTLLWLPGEEQSKVVLEGSFVFKHERHRFVAEMVAPGTGIEGTIRVENRIRELGQEQWLSQVYEIRVEKMTLSQKSLGDD